MILLRPGWGTQIAGVRGYQWSSLREQCRQYEGTVDRVSLNRRNLVPDSYLCIVRIDLLGAIVLVVSLASLAVHARPDLSSHANSVANFEFRDFVANSGDFPSNLVASDHGQNDIWIPSTCDCVDVASTDLRAKQRQ